jgi:hypothetical protein
MIVSTLAAALQTVVMAAPVNSGVSVSLSVSDFLLVLNALAVIGNLTLTFKGKK